MWKLHRYIPCNKTCKTEQTQMFPKEIFIIIIIIILIILILRLICLYKSAGSTQFVAWEPQAPAALGWLRLCWFAIEKAGPGRNAWIWCAWSFKVSKDSITLLFPLKSSAVRLSNKVSNKVDFICWTWENEPKKKRALSHLMRGCKCLSAWTAPAPAGRHRLSKWARTSWVADRWSVELRIWLTSGTGDSNQRFQQTTKFGNPSSTQREKRRGEHSQRDDWLGRPLELWAMRQNVWCLFPTQIGIAFQISWNHGMEIKTKGCLAN